MIRPVSGAPSARHLICSLAAVILTTVGWYAAQPVHTDCVYFGGPDYSYDDAVADGQCPAPQTRWETWIS
ncbi:hypothetical protein QMZ92_26180 [Streptomyces sp. HNM0645]|uniref:hypothetical protein n=1 Tax=Streptomyces sp. HNM0645 TaxID=2782343 RepID=UPI0024B6C6E1|nr:hypothetical protein [Streptomyces sp. HNM0645]MDI9887763.1 hypothetical protein [Streptomyces sp. HNM0645]